MSLHDAGYWMTVHDRVCRSDGQAREEFCSLLPVLTGLLCRKHPKKRDEAAESAEDALLGYLSDPTRFDPCRGCSLVTWLAIQAWGHLSHRLRREQRHRVHEKAVGIAEKIFEEKMSEVDVERAIYRGGDGDEIGAWRQKLDKMMWMLAPCDRGEVYLLRRGASCEEWVRHLHVEDLPTKEQCHRINIEKDRLKKKLRRLARKMLEKGGKEG